MLQELSVENQECGIEKSQIRKHVMKGRNRANVERFQGITRLVGTVPQGHKYGLDKASQKGTQDICFKGKVQAEPMTRILVVTQDLDGMIWQ